MWWERERERFPSSRWQQLLIKSGPMKQDSRQEPISLWIMPYLSFSCFSLHSTSTMDSLHLSRQILEVRGRKKKRLHILDSPVDQYKSFFSESAIIERETLNWKYFQDFFKSEAKRTLINQKSVCWFSSSTDWKHSTADFQWMWMFPQLQHLLSWSPTKYEKVSL